MGATTVYRSECKDFTDSMCEAFTRRGVACRTVQDNGEYVVEVGIPSYLAREILKEENVI